jgi:transcriptional regulator with XRE-family HTH domain
MRDMVGEQDLTFGSRLRGLREGAGLTQEELALRAGLSPRAISALERGERQRPYPHTVRTLAEALGLTEEERASLLATLQGAPPLLPPHWQQLQSLTSQYPRLLFWDGSGSWMR